MKKVLQKPFWGHFLGAQYCSYGTKYIWMRHWYDIKNLNDDTISNIDIGMVWTSGNSISRRSF